MIGRARNLDALSILDIYTALGGHLSPRSAGKHEAEGTCWGPHSHGTDQYNLRLNNEKGTWACHCQGERGGGGKLDLIALAGHTPNGDPKGAIEWLIAQGLLHEPERFNGIRPTVVATFRYEHEDHVLIAKVDRVEPGRNGKPKEFYPYLWDGTKYEKKPGLKDRKLPLYRLPELRQAINAGERIFLVEGEGKADKLREALRAAGIAGAVTTLFGGTAGKLTDDNLYQLRGLKNLDIIADSDTPGRKAARTRAEQIAQLDVTVKLLDLYPERDGTEKGLDVADWLDEEHTVPEFIELIENATIVERSTPTTANAPKETEERSPKSKRKFIRLDTATMVTTAPRYICFGILRRALTIIEGIGAVGKSTLMYWICAILTLGSKFPDGSKNDPMNIAIISVEDIIDVVVEKLRIYQVEHSRIHLLPSMEDDSGKPWRFLIDQDAGALRQYIIEHNIELFYIDAFVSHVGHGNDLWKGQAARYVMTILQEIAISTGCAIVVTRHWKKGTGPASERGANSIEIRNVARGSMVVGLHPENPDIHVLAPEKGNYKKGGGQSYGFRIQSCNVTFGDGKEFDLGRVVPIGPVDVTADDLALAEAKPSKGMSVVGQAREAILQALLDGPLTAEALQIYVKGKGCKKTTIERARHALCQEKLILFHREGGGKDSRVLWSVSDLGRRSIGNALAASTRALYDSLAASPLETVKAKVKEVREVSHHIAAENMFPPDRPHRQIMETPAHDADGLITL